MADEALVTEGHPRRDRSEEAGPPRNRCRRTSGASASANEAEPASAVAPDRDFALAMMLLVAACLALLMGSGETTFLVPAAVAVLLFFLLSRTEQSSGFDAHAAEIRKRVDDGSTTMHLSLTGEGTTVNIAPALGPDPATMRASASLEKQEAILREIYTQGACAGEDQLSSEHRIRLDRRVAASPRHRFGRCQREVRR
jgi:hypothetical protein